MITIETSDSEVRVSIPTGEVDPVRLEQFLRPLRWEQALSQSQLTEEEADEMADSMKAEWWEKNKGRFLPPEELASSGQ
ncbi:MAG: hypothetical protein KDM63_05065 [Verrucomicrobiae bacterium]|nr:hypothetical protein [Verrucomicrobiae bacterium]